ncbi:hypothetical protein F4678DRAFT_413602 [Xylaria arbuscula]|nr:hypothetical protein F4678DRAFT_413602 [Xylaria arbuscula]
MSTQTSNREQIVGLFDDMPHRYMFVPGTGDFTARCREKAHAIGRAVYVVLDSAGEIAGVRVPHYVVDSLIFEESMQEEDADSMNTDTNMNADEDADSDWETEALLRMCGFDPDINCRDEPDWVECDEELIAGEDEYVPSSDTDSDSSVCDDSMYESDLISDDDDEFFDEFYVKE